MKTSRIKRLVPKKLARQLALTTAGGRDELEASLERRGSDVIAKMKAKGYRLVACLDSGEGVFARDDKVAALHIQLPVELYRRVDGACRERGITKRGLVIAALEAYFARVEAV